MPKKSEEEVAEKPSGVDAFVGTLEWLIIAFASTLVFIVFEMQAYTIPTGSMADTLKGAHFRLRCNQCGYRYDFAFVPERSEYGMARNTTPGNNVPVMPKFSRCPSCGYSRQSAEYKPVIKGDRIFVLKCLYQYFEPKRWDVVVFKNPLKPHENYIKRLVALPGEKVEIIDGDIYIDDEIARKPQRVQDELWMCVFDNDYQPVNPQEGNFHGRVWEQPFVKGQGSEWNLHADGATVFGLDSATEETHKIFYDTRRGNDFRATYAYNEPGTHHLMPICSDLMICFDVDNMSSGGKVGASLTKYGIEYRGWIDFSGAMVLEKVHSNGLVEELRREPFEVEGCGRGFRFANVDHKLVLEIGDEKLEYEMDTGRDAMGARGQTMPRAAIFGAGTLRIRHVGLYRDIHYINRNPTNGSGILRAGEGDPFTLGADEFFVLGDNSPASLDCRLWAEPGTGNAGHEYREGTVPRDYLVGKAFFVYWPGPFKPFNDKAFVRRMERVRLGKILKILLNVPYVDGMKIIDGGV